MLSITKSPAKLPGFASQLGRIESNSSALVAEDDLIPDYVSFADYLPNSLKRSPLKRGFS